MPRGRKTLLSFSVMFFLFAIISATIEPASAWWRGGGYYGGGWGGGAYGGGGMVAAGIAGLAIGAVAGAALSGAGAPGYGAPPAYAPPAYGCVQSPRYDAWGRFVGYSC